MSVVAGLLMIVVGTAAPVPMEAAYRADRPEVARIAPVRFTAGLSGPASPQARWRLPQLSLPLASTPDPEPQFRWRGPIVEFRMPLPLSR